MKKIAADHPLIMGLIIFLSILIIQGGVLIVVELLRSGMWEVTAVSPTSQIITELIITLIMVFFLSCLGWLNDSWILRLGDWRIWLLTLLVLVYILVGDLYVFYGGINLNYPTWKQAGPTLFNQLTTGLSEEILFRGIVLMAMMRVWGKTMRGRQKAVFLSAFVFGLMHLPHLLAGVSPWAVLLLVLFCILSGIFSGALVLYGKTIWPAVLLHGMENAVVSATAITAPSIGTYETALITISLLQLPLVMMSVFWLRRSAGKTAVSASITAHPQS